MKKFTIIRTIAAVIEYDNIDTDQIIGSDYLKTTNKSGLGKNLFSDWRFMNNGTIKKNFVLNNPITKGAEVLIVGDNFGCGSSREHAPWALLDYGIKAVISSSIADIFFNNSIKNGLLPIRVSKEQHKFLLAKNAVEIEVDLVNLKINCEGKSFTFELEAFDRYCLINGLDQLDFLLGHSSDIDCYEEKFYERLSL
jgi:3-isopropylmalate/(R)-2-methylmalate dehydratase small subunit